MLKLLSVLSLIIFQKSLAFEIRVEVIQSRNFEFLMPCAFVYQIDQLVDYLNADSNATRRITLVNQWLDEKWATPNDVNDPDYDLQQGCNVFSGDKKYDKELIRDQLITFVKQRAAVRALQKSLYRSTRDSKFFSEDEAIRMRDIFWATDYYTGNHFELLWLNFFDKIDKEFGSTHKHAGDQLKLMAWKIRDDKEYQEILDWTFEWSKF